MELDQDPEGLLRQLYLQHNPQKVEEIPRLLKKWSGRHAELVAQVRRKYERAVAAGGGGASPALRELSANTTRGALAGPAAAAAGAQRCGVVAALTFTELVAVIESELHLAQQLKPREILAAAKEVLGLDYPESLSLKDQAQLVAAELLPAPMALPLAPVQQLAYAEEPATPTAIRQSRRQRRNDFLRSELMGGSQSSAEKFVAEPAVRRGLLPWPVLASWC